MNAFLNQIAISSTGRCRFHPVPRMGIFCHRCFDIVIVFLHPVNFCPAEVWFYHIPEESHRIVRPRWRHSTRSSDTTAVTCCTEFDRGTAGRNRGERLKVVMIEIRWWDFYTLWFCFQAWSSSWAQAFICLFLLSPTEAHCWSKQLCHSVLIQCFLYRLIYLLLMWLLLNIQQIWRKQSNGIVKYSNKNQVPKRFPTRKTIAKCQTQYYTELFYSNIFKLNKGSLHTKFHTHTPLWF